MVDVFTTLYPVLATLVYGAVLVLMIWALYDIGARKNFRNKALWVVVIIGLPLIGSLGYLIGARNK